MCPSCRPCELVMLTSLKLPGWTKLKFLTAKDTRNVGPTVDWLLSAPFEPGESIVIPHPTHFSVTGPALTCGVSVGNASTNVASRIDAPIHCFFRFIFFLNFVDFSVHYSHSSSKIALY